MPVNYSRIEVHFEPEINDQLARFSEEVLEKTGKKISKAKLVKRIVEEFFIRSSLAIQDKSSK